MLAHAWLSSATPPGGAAQRLCHDNKPLRRSMRARQVRQPGTVLKPFSSMTLDKPLALPMPWSALVDYLCSLHKHVYN